MLMCDNRIKDPFLGFNELDCEWVGEKSWTYKVELPAAKTSSAGIRHVLAFDGLDTFATVKLDGETILKSDNMFIYHRVDVTDKLKTGTGSVLEIDFKPALAEAQKVKDAHPEHKWVGFNGDMARLAVRKAQYHLYVNRLLETIIANRLSGWDWGPILTTCGPWKDIRLETYEARVEDLQIDYEVDSSLSKVSGKITAFVDGTAGDRIKFSANLNGEEVFNGSAELNDQRKAEVEFHVSNPKLWYPHGYGEQPLYTVNATLAHGEHDLHSISRKTGFRKTELVQIPDKIGKTFYFRVNGVGVFCGGSDWIPADSFVSVAASCCRIRRSSLTDTFRNTDSQNFRRSLPQMAPDDGGWLPNHDPCLGRRHLGRRCILRYLR
jgi:beta-mannosidase